MNRKGIALISAIIAAAVILLGCTGNGSSVETDISGTYYGYETYTSYNSTGIPDTLTFPWTMVFKRTDTAIYTVSFYHPATNAVGSIKAAPEYKLSVDNIKFVGNSYIGITNYVQLYFESKDGSMLANGHFNVIKSTGPADVRVVTLVRTSKN